MDYGRRDGGFRGGNNRKRRFRDDDDGYDRRNKRRQYEEPAHTKLRKYLSTLADSPHRKPEEEVSNIVKIVNETTDDEQLRKTFLETIVQLTVEQPLKIPFLAAVAVLSNASSATLVKELIGQASEAANEALKKGDWITVKLYLRLLGSLQPILSGDGIFPVLDELFSRAADLQTASAEDALGLELVKVILVTLAYTMKVAGASRAEQAASILEKTDIVASAPHSLHSLVNPTIAAKGEETGSGPEWRSLIGMLQQQLQQEAGDGWPLKCLPALINSTELGEQHDLPAIVVPTPVLSSVVPKLPELYFSVFQDQEYETTPRLDNIASSLIRDVLIDAVNQMHFNRNISARILIDIPYYFAEGTFTERGTPFDKIKDIEEGRSTWKPEDVAIDAVFSQLMTLPAPEQKVVYYHSVLTETCKLAPSAVAPSLGRAIRFMYKSLATMDLEVAYRFNDWFAHHLSNFGFTWKWTEWIPDLEQPATHPKKAFIMATLDKEIRLSFAQRIRGTLPEQYIPLIPESKDKDVPDFKFSNDDVPYAAHAKEIMRLIRSKAADAEFQPHVAAIESEAVEAGESDPVLVSTNVFMTCLCFAGAKSLSHVLNHIQRTRERLLAITTSSSEPEAVRRQIIDSVMAYWAEKPGVGVNIVDKLLNYTILTPMSVIDWAVVGQLRRGELLAANHVFELVAGTVNKVARRIRQIVTARRQRGLTVQQVESLDAAFEAENGQMKRLFAVLEDGLRGIAEGSNDAMIEGKEEEGLDELVLRTWGRRWLKTFTRKLAVEQAWMTETMARPLPEPEPEPEPEAKAAGESEGSGESGSAAKKQKTEGEENGNGAAEDKAMEVDATVE